MKKTILLALLFAVVILVSGEIVLEEQIDISPIEIGLALIFGGLAAWVQQSTLPKATQQS